MDSGNGYRYEGTGWTIWALMFFVYRFLKMGFYVDCWRNIEVRTGKEGGKARHGTRRRQRTKRQYGKERKRNENWKKAESKADVNGKAESKADVNRKGLKKWRRIVRELRLEEEDKR